MQKLREHFTGSEGSSLMTDRFKFWHLTQNPHESVQDWEVKVRQAGNLCTYEAAFDEMCRDKFVFGLNNDSIRTELLKTHLKADNSKKSMSDVVNEAKALEIALKTNQLIVDSSKGIEEQVHWNQFKKDTSHKDTNHKDTNHKDMKLRRDPNTCHWCGSTRGPHAWRNCPAKGKRCTRCGGNDHFSKVCLENPSKSYQQDFTPNQRGGRGKFRNNYRNHPQQYRANYQQQQQPIHSLTEQDNNDEHEYYTDNYEIYTLDSTQTINSIGTSTGNKYYAHLHISSTGKKFSHIKFQIDTAATCNTISEKTIKSNFPDAHIKKSPLLLYPYGNAKPITPRGQVELLCERKGKYHTLAFQVLPDNVMQNKPALLSGKDCIQLKLVDINPDEVHCLQPKILKDENKHSINSPNCPLTRKSILNRYANNFSGIGCLEPPVSFKMKQGVTPVQMPIHRVPISKRAKEKSAIEKYVKEGILEKVQEPTPWCSNILCRESPTKFRVCIDPSQTINNAIERPLFQMPTLNEQLHKLANAKCFYLVDVREGYHHIPLDEESSLLTTMHTSYGRYRWKRMPFGINSAPEEFQGRLMNALEGLDGIILVADDILTFGSGDTYEEAEANHDINILALMERAKDRNIKFNEKKLQFKKKEIKFVGHILTDNGIKADPSKIDAILKMEAPHDKASLLRFIGMVNFLSPFCENLSNTIRPLTDLTKENMIFIWSDVQNKAFLQAKTLLTNTPVLQYFNLDKPVTLQVDASENGLGGTLMQPNEEGKLQPVAYTSSTLTNTEKRYSQIEKECLAICNVFTKFDQWLYGKTDIEVHSDHKPLETIFKKPLNKAPARLQRMMMKLQRYQFKVTYKKGSSLHIADTLSRAALPTSTDNKVTGFEVFRLDVENQYPDQHPNFRQDTEQQLQAETKKDPALQKLQVVIMHGWPNLKSELEPSLSPYWKYRDELSCHQGIIYKGHLVLIPGTMQKEMLHKLHKHHFGATSTIRLAKDVFFWQGMRKSIQDLCDSCFDCAKFQTTAPKEPMRSLPVPTLPWQIVSQDLFEYDKKSYLVSVCHFSDWIEVDALSDTLSSTVIEHTKAHFARYGVPQICHTDNGPQFISREYQSFATSYSFQHTKSSPYYAKGNGRAEAAVKVTKSMLKKSEDFNAALLNYRNTPQQGHSYSPVQRMMNHRTRTLIPTSNTLLAAELVNSEVVVADIEQKRKTAKTAYDRTAVHEHAKLEPRSYVYVKPPPHKKGLPWSYGQIIEGGLNRSYTISTPKSVVRRNRVHIRPAAPPKSPMYQPIIVVPPLVTRVTPPTMPSCTTDDISNSVPTTSTAESTLHRDSITSEHELLTPTKELRRPVRECKPPKKFKDYEM